MVKNIIALWIVVWSNVCYGGEYTLDRLGLMESLEQEASGVLQIFFQKKQQKYVPAARIVNGFENISISNIDALDFLKNKERLEKFVKNSAFSRNEKGGFVLLGETSANSNLSYKYPFFCRNNEGIEKTFYVKEIYHTGITEKLLDMPECSVELRSDSIELILNNGRNTSNDIFPAQTIVDPGHVKAIRECIKVGKVFVVDLKGIGNNKPAAYKVLGYKNNAYMHWDGWWHIQFFWKYVGKNLELSGFERAEDVRPEEKIELDMIKNYDQESAYRTGKNLRALLYMIIGSYAAFTLYASWK